MVSQTQEVVKSSRLKRCALKLSKITECALTLCIRFLKWVRSFARGAPVAFGAMLTGILFMLLVGFVMRIV